MDATSTLEQARAALAGMDSFIASPTDHPFVTGTEKSFKHGYWRNQNGEIVIGGMWPNEFMEQSNRGWTPLRAYGVFDMYSDNMAWNRDQFRYLLERGGAKEFSKAQILEFGWHRKPPLPGINFPQLDGDETLRDVECGHCGKKYLNTRDLASHESVTHRAVSQNQGLSRALAESLGKNAEKQNEPMVQFLALMAEKMDQQAEAQRQQGEVIAALLQRLVPIEVAPSKK